MIQVQVVDTRMDHKWMWARLVQILSILSVDILHTDGKVCVKREELGGRDGNMYNCDNPDLSECCERNRTFTCCQPAAVAVMHDQLWLLLCVVVLAVMMCGVISCCYGQSEFFRSPTAKDAARNWKDKFVHTFTFGDHKTGSEFHSLGSKPLAPSSQFSGSHDRLLES